MVSPTHIKDARRLGQVETGDSVADRRDRLNDDDTVKVRLRRFDPTRDDTPYFEDFQVPWSPLMRVLDVLNHIVEDQEEDLGYRWYCGTKKCGTCAVRVNGREVLACWEPAEPVMEIEPLRHVALFRDLAVDRTAYEEKVGRMQPWLHRREPYSGFPERLSHGDMEGAARALDCLSCLCVSGHYEPWLRDRTQCGGGSWLCGPRSERRGSSANSDFHIRGVSSMARLAGCMLMRWSTSIR